MQTYCLKLDYTQLDYFKDLLYLFEEVFEMDDFEMPSSDYLINLLKEDNFMAVVAIKDRIVIGGLTGYILKPYYHQEPFFYVYDLAVNAEMQRQKIGTQLMNYVLTNCKEQGYQEVFVQADKIDEHALKFYTSLGGVEEHVSHFNYPLQ